MSSVFSPCNYITYTIVSQIFLKLFRMNCGKYWSSTHTIITIVVISLYYVAKGNEEFYLLMRTESTETGQDSPAGRNDLELETPVRFTYRLKVFTCHSTLQYTDTKSRDFFLCGLLKFPKRGVKSPNWETKKRQRRRNSECSSLERPTAYAIPCPIYFKSMTNS